MTAAIRTAESEVSGRHVMRREPAVEEDQVPGLGADHRAGPVDVSPASRLPAMGNDQFAARATIMVGAEEQAGERVGINVALETHPRPPQHVQDGSVSLVMRRGDRAANGALGKFAEPGTVQPAKPRKVAGQLAGVHPAPGDVPHVGRLAGDDGRAGKVPEISTSHRIPDVLPPARWEHPGHVECRPLKRGQHRVGTSLGPAPGPHPRRSAHIMSFGAKQSGDKAPRQRPAIRR